ncbi:CYTH domain-containing protein [Planococcus sp. A6]|uniref:CYTH domain-containing protein n=1 Tax=Planococcus sp. A6 TaxID=2992760 RepID=UPI00237C3A15|nr:CYTH domain-containing protein [Planococcus sp. A6]MDE0581452.1 CYTH domain-containing protein [Planococcus sp. A6]
MEIEKELKLLLKENTYHILLQEANNVKSKIIQENYYFDTPTLDLGRRGITLRIRKENEKWLLCLKAKQLSLPNNSYASSLEFEQEVSADVFQKCTTSPSIIFSYLPPEGGKYITETINDLKLLGSLKNIRYSIELFKDYSHKFELDHSFFPNGKEEYELEIEGIENERDSLNVIEKIKKLGVVYNLNNKSKYKRFIESL